MSFLFGISLLMVGAFLLVRSQAFVGWLTDNVSWFEEADESTGRENTVVVSVIMLVAGLVFFVL